MQVEHAFYAYYEERSYALKRQYTLTSHAEFDADIVHRTNGPIRIANVSVTDMSLCVSVLCRRLPLVRLITGSFSRSLVMQERLGEFIHTTPTIQELDLWDVGSTLSVLVAPLTQHKNIKVLSFRESLFTADDIKAMADILQNNAIITELSLRDCGIDDDNGTVIAEALSHNTKLSKLTLERNSFGIRLRPHYAMLSIIPHPLSHHSIWSIIIMKNA